MLARRRQISPAPTELLFSTLLTRAAVALSTPLADPNAYKFGIAPSRRQLHTIGSIRAGLVGWGICCLVLISDSAALLLLSRPGLLKFGVLGFLLLVRSCAASPISVQILVTDATFLSSVLGYSSRCHILCRLWRSKSSFGIDASVVSSCSVVGLGLFCSSSGVKTNRVLC